MISNNDLVLRKPGQDICFVGDRVVKYFSEPEIVKNRLMRAKVLEDVIPKEVEGLGNLLIYKKANGLLGTHVFPQDPDRFKHFLDWCPSSLWKSIDNISIEDQCRKFYYDKTYSRLAALDRATQVSYKYKYTINGRDIPSVESMLNLVDWDGLCDVLGVRRFHGDLHSSNILTNGKDGYTLLDWREDFGGSTEYGDIYYDLAKLNHGLILSYNTLVDDKKYAISFESYSRVNSVYGPRVSYAFDVSTGDVRCKRIFDTWVKENGYLLDRVELLTALIFLNIAVLHESSKNLLFYFLGADLLYDYCLSQDFHI